MSGWFVYFITRLAYLQTMLILLLTISSIASIVAGVVWSINLDDGDTETANIVKRLALKIILPIMLVASILLSATPSTKEMAAIYMIPKIVNNEQIHQLPNNALEFLNSELRQWVKDISPSESATKDSE